MRSGRGKSGKQKFYERLKEYFKKNESLKCYLTYI